MNKNQIFKIRQRALWGDWGQSLIKAQASHRKEGTEPLRIDRIGPFVPPLYTASSTVFVTNPDFICSLVGKSIKFIRVQYDQIKFLDWHKWDFSAPEPGHYPQSNSPSGYYEEARVATVTEIAEMTPSWELVPKPVVCKFSFQDLVMMTGAVLNIDSESYSRACDMGIFTDSFSETSTMVTCSVATKLTEFYGDWITLHPVELRIN